MLIGVKRLISLFLSFLQLFALSHGWKAAKFTEKADIDFMISQKQTYQTVTGFGASACWWAQDIGNGEKADEILRLLYAKEGLGLNIYRYNIGAGEKENPASRIRGNRATESFYYYDADRGVWDYDFSRDAAAQNALRLALSYGCVDTVVLFANSPHYSMTVSGQATGGTEEYASNLPRENYEAYADYFLTVARHFIEAGVPVRYLSPINEPQWSWGGGWVGQEGCHYEPDEVIELMRVFARKITASGLDVKLMAPESGDISEQTSAWFDALCADAEIARVLGSLAYHSYWSDDNIENKRAFGDRVKARQYPFPVDMTEWCELPLAHDTTDFDGALRTARVIMQDLVYSGANSWSAWVGVNSYGLDENGLRRSDGLISANGDGADYEIAARYYALAHFSRFLPAGSVRIAASPDVYDSKTEDGVRSLSGIDHAAFRTPDGKTVFVIVNSANERKISLSGVGKCGGELWQSTAEEKMAHKKLSLPVGIELPAESITTVIL